MQREIHWRQGISDRRDSDPSGGQLHSGVTEYGGNGAGILLLRDCRYRPFRKVNGYSYASTMCIGNIRSGTASAFRLPQGTQTGAVEAGVILYRDYFLLCDRSRNRRQSVYAIWNPGDSDFRRVVAGKPSVDVY